MVREHPGTFYSPRPPKSAANGFGWESGDPDFTWMAFDKETSMTANNVPLCLSSVSNVQCLKGPVVPATLLSCF